MAENKQYVTQVQDCGSILISEEVLATVTIQALQEVEGVAGLNAKHGTELSDLLAKKSWGKGLKIVIAEDNSVSVDCELLIGYGCSVIDVAKAAQEAITTQLESITNVQLHAVNINVAGIVRS